MRVVKVCKEGALIGSTLEIDVICGLAAERTVLVYELLLCCMIQVVCGSTIVAEESKLLAGVIAVGCKAEVYIRLQRITTLSYCSRGKSFRMLGL